MKMRYIFIYCYLVVVLIEQIVSQTAQGTLQLYNGNTGYEGILEIFYDGVWNSVTSNNWEATDGKVACRQMGFSGYVTYSTSSQNRQSHWSKYVSCTGREASIISCSILARQTRYSYYYGRSVYGSVSAIYIHCSLSAADTLRLFGGTTKNKGTLEAFHSNHWISICSANWNSMASDAVCKQLGFSEHLSYTSSSTITSTLLVIDFSCLEQESPLVTCISSSQHCGTHQGISLHCKLPANGTLRLYNGEIRNEGILEAFHGYRWGSICEDYWDAVSSEVACKLMGFPGYISYTSNYTKNSYWLDNVRCNGNEASISSCYNSGWGFDRCQPAEGIFLKCNPSVPIGRVIHTIVHSLENYETLYESTTLYCTTDVINSTSKIGWSFTPFSQDIEELLTEYSDWQPTYGVSKLDISTSKLGYYSCHTSTEGILIKYTVILTQKAIDKDCQGGYCFGVFRTDTAINWATAQSNCMSWGGDLASIRSMGEEKYILSLGESHYGSCWIGHHDRYNEAGNNGSLFVSVGGSNSLYRNFYTNEPNENGNEDCVMLRDWIEGEWSDTSCYSTLNCYVCGKLNCKDGSCFEVITPNTSVNWYSAQYQCEQKGGSLASIKSEPEERFILNLMTESNSQCWIGLNDRSREANTNPNKFVWEDGNGAVYRHFRNETVNSSTDCVVLSRDDGTWLSTECDNTQSCYICRGTEICSTGYEFITEQYDCVDINECSVANDCEQICTNTVGSYMCSCMEIYYLSNFTSCDLIYLNIDLNGISYSTNSIQISWNTAYRPIDRLSEIVYHVWIRDVTFLPLENFLMRNTTNNWTLQIMGMLPYRTYELYIIAVDAETTNTSNTVTVQTLTGTPSTFPSFTAFSTNAITIRLNLTLPSKETRNGIIIGYSILYSRVDSTEHIEINIIDASYDVYNLQPFIEYHFKAAAITSAGTGVYTENVYVRTRESIPTGFPEIILIEKSPKAILLQLIPPEEVEEINGVIISYSVKYTGIIIDTSERMITFLVNSTDFLTPIEGNLTDLEEGIEYNIQARISTFVGGGPYSSAVTVTTIETAPTGPPLQFRIILQLSTVLTLYWTHPELQLQNGVITGYLVHYHGLSIDTEERNFTTQSVYVNLTNLEEGALYEISVCALNRAGDGPCVELTNRTREIPPEQTPQNVQVEVNGSTSLLVCWDSLLKREENGIIVSYVITAVGQGYDTSVYEWTANSTARCYSCENLQEANEYRLSMSAVNSAGTGPFSSAVVIVTEEDVPSAAPVGLFGVGTENLILLVWDPPRDIDRNGEIVNYEVLMFGTSVNRTRTHMFTLKLRIVINDLCPGDTYNIKIRAYTLLGAGPYSRIMTVDTDETTPSAPPTNVTLTPVYPALIIVAWQEPPLAHRNGAITGYDISLLSNGTSLAAHTHVGELTRAYTFRDTLANSTYFVRVRARTIPGVGPYSDAISTTTYWKSPVE